MAWSKNKQNLASTSVGTFTANGTTGVVFAPAVAVGPGTDIGVSMKTVGGTPAAHPYIFALTTGQPGTASITFKAAAGDTSVYNVYIAG